MLNRDNRDERIVDRSLDPIGSKLAEQARWNSVYSFEVYVSYILNGMPYCKSSSGGNVSQTAVGNNMFDHMEIQNRSV